jgi:hypothetical protein
LRVIHLTTGIDLVVREGDLLPTSQQDAEKDARFGIIKHPVSINSSGTVAFRSGLASFTGPSGSASFWGLWSGVYSDFDGLDLAVSQREQAAGFESGVGYGLFFLHHINDDGDIAFTAVVTVDNDRGVWLKPSGGPAVLLARSGEAAGNQGEVFTKNAFVGASINAGGEVAFQAIVVDIDNNQIHSYWTANSNGTASLNKVVQSGDLVEISPGILRTITINNRPVSNNRDGRLSDFDDRGTFVVVGGLTDGANNPAGGGIFVSRTNEAPIAVASAPGVVGCSTSAGAVVLLDGTGSSDPNGDLLSYSWTGPFPEGGGTVTGATPSVTLPIGTSTITLVVNDGFLDSQPDETQIQVTVSVSGFENPFADLVASGTPPEPDKAFKGGRILPLRLTLSCGSTLLSSADVAGPTIASLFAVGEGPLDLDTLDIDAGEANDSGLAFRSDDSKWVYNLSTSGFATKKYEIKVAMPDGTTHTGAFVLR